MKMRDRIRKAFGENEYLNGVLRKIQEAGEIVLFGAGSAGIKALSYITDRCNVKILAFCDNNPMKWGTKCEGLFIYKPEECFMRYPNALFLITCGEGKDIIKQLKNISGGGIKDEQILIFDAYTVSLTGKNGEYIWNHIEKYEEAYRLLEDRKSRDVFVQLLNYRISMDMSLIQSVCSREDEQYFDSELFRFTGKEKWVDAGAYIGDTIEQYLNRTNNQMNTIYCFEADDKNFNALCSKIDLKQWKGVKAYNCALWKHADELAFNNMGSGSGRIEEGGTQKVIADTIDQLVTEKIDFIKMDIEGAEYCALQGAEKIIKKYTPVLMVSVYHRIEDFYRIPLLIQKMNQDYRFYFRHYRELSGNETVCYAIADSCLIYKIPVTAVL